jgi:hypothetical protein
MLTEQHGSVTHFFNRPLLVSFRNIWFTTELVLLNCGQPNGANTVSSVLARSLSWSC